MKEAASDATTGGRALSAAVVGCGRVGELHAAAFADNGDASLAAVCDPDISRGRRLAERYGAASYGDFREMLRSTRLDLVTIATPDACHCEPAIASLEAGCHVFCEKPLATRIDEAQNMVAAADKAGRFLGVDFNRRYGFAYRRASELIRDKAIGTPQNAILRVTDRYPPTSARTSPTAILTTLLTHHFDLFRWLIDEPRTVSLTGAVDPVTGLLSRVIIAFGFRNGAVGTIAATYRIDQAHTQETLTIVGTAGIMTIDDVTRGVTVIVDNPENEKNWRADPWKETAFWDTISDHVRAFASAIRRGEIPPVTGRDGLESLRIAAAAERSWKLGRTVEIADEF